MTKPLSTLFSVVLISSLSAQGEIKEFSAAQVKKVYVENQAGQISIADTESEKASVSFDSRNTETICDISIEMVNDTLETKVTTKKEKRSFWKFFSSSNCAADIQILVPKLVSVDVVNGSGDVDIQGVQGRINFKIGSGNLNVNSKVEKLVGKSGSGNVDVLGLKGDVDVKVGSGNISLIYPDAVEKGEVMLKAGSGNIQLALPSTMKIMTHFKAGSGQVSNEFTDSENSKFSVSAAVGSGSMRVKKL